MMYFLFCYFYFLSLLTINLDSCLEEKGIKFASKVFYLEERGKAVQLLYMNAQ